MLNFRKCVFWRRKKIFQDSSPSIRPWNILPPSQVTLSIYSQFIPTCIYVVLCKKLIFTFGPQDQIRCGRVSSKDVLLHVVEINTIFYTLSNIAIGLLRKSSAGIKNSWRWLSFASDNMKGHPNGTESPVRLEFTTLQGYNHNILVMAGS